MTKKIDATKNLPDRPLSPYLLWLQDNIAALKKKHPKLTASQMEQQAEKLWAKQPANVKTTYTQRGLAARVKFAVDMLGHMKKITSDDEGKGAKKAQTKPESKSKKITKAAAKAKPVAKSAVKKSTNAPVKKAASKSEKPKRTITAKPQLAVKAKEQSKQIKKAVQEKAKKVIKASAKATKPSPVAKPSKQPVAKKTALPAKTSIKSK